MKKDKQYTFAEFKEFLNEKCYNVDYYQHGKYDRKIYNWFDLNKPRKVKFYEKGKFTKFNAK